MIDLCYKIENQTPRSLEELYVITHESTNKFNELQEEFCEHDSEIETVTKGFITLDFEFIAKAYGCMADIEE